MFFLKHIGIVNSRCIPKGFYYALRATATFARVDCLISAARVLYSFDSCLRSRL